MLPLGSRGRAAGYLSGMEWNSVEILSTGQTCAPADMRHPLKESKKKSLSLSSHVQIYLIHVKSVFRAPRFQVPAPKSVSILHWAEL